MSWAGEEEEEEKEEKVCVQVVKSTVLGYLVQLTCRMAASLVSPARKVALVASFHSLAMVEARTAMVPTIAEMPQYTYSVA